MFDEDETELFLGIGSVLWDGLPKESKKIVFGSGYGGYTSHPILDDTWKFYFVRGRRSADLIGIDRSFGIGDPAVLVRVALTHLPAPIRNHRIGFMPHWESAADGNWDKVAKRANILFVDPRGDVEAVIQQIRSCNLLITEAMHGAIVADALRTPWIPYAPPVTHHMKWYDWADSMDLIFEFAPSSRSSILELLTSAVAYNKGALRNLRKYGGLLRRLGSSIMIDVAANSLERAALRKPNLSSDAQLESVTCRILSQLDKLRADYPGKMARGDYI